MMGLYSEAVSLALNNNIEDMAKTYANKPQNVDVKKKLWLQVLIKKNKFNKNKYINFQIAIHLLNKKGEANI